MRLATSGAACGGKTKQGAHAYQSLDDRANPIHLSPDPIRRTYVRSHSQLIFRFPQSPKRS